MSHIVHRALQFNVTETMAATPWDEFLGAL